MAPIQQVDMSKANEENILVVVPAFNEASHVGPTVRSIIEATRLAVLVVNDSSQDDTAAEATKSGARVISLATRLGAWGATQTGLRYALRQGYKTVVTVDADGQHDPKEIQSLIKALSRLDVHMVIGACPSRGSAARKSAWSLFRVLSGLDIRDLTSGFRAYSAASLELLTQKCATGLDYQDVGILCLLRQAGLKVAEVTVNMYPRKGGKSKIFNSWFSISQYMLYSVILALGHAKKSD